MRGIRTEAPHAGGFPEPRGINSAAFQGEDANTTLVSVGAPPAPPNQAQFTFSFWLHRTTMSDEGRQNLIVTCSSHDTQLQLSNNQLRMYSGSGGIDVTWPIQFTDTTDFYHVCLRGNANAVNGNERLLLEVNGEFIATTGSPAWPAQDYGFGWNHGTGGHYIGAHHSSPSISNSLDGRVFDFTFVAGSYPDALSFAESFDGSWIPLTNPAGVTWLDGCYRLQFNDSGNLGLDTKPSGTPIAFTNTNGVVQFQDGPMSAVCQLDDNTPPRPGSISHASYFDHEPRRCGTRMSRTGTINRISVGTLLLPITDVKWMVEVTVDNLTTTDVKIGFAEHRLLDNDDIPSIVRMAEINPKNGSGRERSSAGGSARTWTAKWTEPGALPYTVCVGVDPTTNEFVMVGPDDTVYREAWTPPEDVIYYLNDRPANSTQRTLTMNFGQVAKARTWPAGFLEPRKSNIPWSLYPTRPREVFNSQENAGTGTFRENALEFDTGLRVVKRALGGTANWIDSDSERGTGPGGKFKSTEMSTSVPEYEPANNDVRVQAPGARIEGTGNQANGTGNQYLDLAFKLSLELGWIQILEPGRGTNFVLPHGLGELPGVVMLKNIDRDCNWHVAHHGSRDSYTEAMMRYFRFNNTAGIPASNGTTMFYQAPDATNLYISSTDPNINPAGGDRIMVWVMPFYRRGVFRSGFYYGVNDESPSRTRGPVLKFDGVLDTLWAKKVTGAENWGIISAGMNPYNPGGRSLRFDTSAEGSHDVRRVHGARMMDGYNVPANAVGNRFNQSGQRYVYWAWLKESMKYARAA